MDCISRLTSNSRNKELKNITDGKSNVFQTNKHILNKLMKPVSVDVSNAINMNTENGDNSLVLGSIREIEIEHSSETKESSSLEKMYLNLQNIERPNSLSRKEKHKVQIPEEKNESNSNLKNSQNQELNDDSILHESEEEEEELYIEDNEIRVANKINPSTEQKMLQSMNQDLSIKTSYDTNSRKMNPSKQDLDLSYFVQFCRLCALPKENMVYIFGEPGRELGLRSKINTWLPTHVSRTDPLPKQVCEHCIKKLDFCNSFGKSCLKAEQMLNNMLNNRKFRYHVRLCEEMDLHRDKSIWKQNSQLKPNGSLFDNVNEPNLNCTSQTSSSIFNRTLEQSNFSATEIEPLLPADDESCNDLMSDDSSESELLDMILNDDLESDNKISKQTNYCCPLCCEGIMMTVKKVPNKTAVTEALGSNSPTNEVVYKKNSLETFNCINMSFMRENDLLEKNNEKNLNNELFVLNIADIKQEDSNSQETILCNIYNNENNDATENEICENSELLNDIKSENDSAVKCVICAETVSNLNECLIHTLKVHGNATSHSFPCSQCDKNFSVDTDLNRHFMLVHQNMKSARLLHICTNCGRRCASQRALESHVCIPVNSVPDQLACSICGQSFSTKARLAFHHRFHEPGTHSLECVPCGMVFAEEDNLYDHIRFSHRGESFICNDCGQHFNSKAALRGHVRSHRNLRHHKCEVCNKTFLDKQTLKEHSVSHMKIKPYQCHVCGKYLNRNSRLKKHLMSHELQKTATPQECYQCTVCGETFPNEPKAAVHAQAGHTLPNEVECVFHLVSVNKVYRCEFCERCFAQPANLNSHRTTHIGETLPFKCHVCGAGFATFARVATHKVTHGIYEKKDEFNIPKMFLCNECEKAYVHWTYLSVHRKMVHAEVKHMYKCKMCPEQFVNSWSLAYHRKTRHSELASFLNTELPITERKRWRCEYCEKRYVSQQSLLTHINMLHAGETSGPSFQCDECGKRFARKVSLETHKKNHNGPRTHICPICKKSFVHSSGLHSHLRLHRGDKPHSCVYCGKTFLQRGDKDDHVRKHTGEKPFACQQCPKTFRTRAMWFEHTRIHRDERPFPCDICGAAFRRSYALKNHKTIHTGERPHACIICGKAFRQKQDMLKHIKSHHQELQEQD